MHKKLSARKKSSGLSLVELSIAIVVIVAISMSGLAIGSHYQTYESGLQVGAALKTIRMAQLAYLSDNPTNSYSSIYLADSTPGGFQSYLPSGELNVLTNYPANGVKCNNQPVTLIVNQYPPVAQTNGVTISTGTDGIWNSGP